MNDRIHRSATKEQRILIEAAREDGRAEGYRTGYIDGVWDAAALLEREGDLAGAARLREAKVVERTEG